MTDPNLEAQILARWNEFEAEYARIEAEHLLEMKAIDRKFQILMRVTVAITVSGVAFVIVMAVIQ